MSFASRRWRRLLLERLEDRTLPSGSTLATALGLSFSSLGTAQASGRLADPRQVDLYRVHLGAGDVLSAAVSAQSTGSGLQSLLRLFNAFGTPLALDDQEGGDPQVTFQVATAGDYYVGVSSAPNNAYDATRMDSGSPGGTVGLYSLSLRDAPAKSLLANLVGGSFRLNTTVATYGETVSGTFTVDNRGGATAGAFDIQVVLSTDNRFGPASQVLTTFTLPGLGAGEAFSSGPFTVTLPSASGLPVAGPVYIGLRIDPAGLVPELNPAGRSGVHRGSDWETLTLVAPLTSSGSNHSLANSVSLGAGNDRVSGMLAAGQADWYQITVTDTVQLTAQATAAVRGFVPGLNLTGPDGRVLIQSDDGSLAQALGPGTYYLTVTAGSGAGSYLLTTTSVQVNPPLSPLPVGRSPVPAIVTDVNGDGKPDLLATNFQDGTVSLLLGEGDGSFQPEQVIPVGSTPTFVAVADLGNGKPDLVVSNLKANTVSVLLGNGDGSFQGRSTVTVGSRPVALAVADVNGDGWLDLVVVSQSGNTVSVLLGSGDGTFAPDPFSSPGLAPGTFAVGSHPIALAVADINGDGVPDLVVTNYQGDTVSLLLGNGDGSFQPQRTVAAGRYPEGVAAADINGDGRLDLVVTNYKDSTVNLLLGNGDGTFQGRTALSVDANPSNVAVADVNGDGRPDVVVVNEGSNTVTVLLSNGQGGFEAQSTGALGVSPASIAVADINGDGKPDLVVANYADNTLQVLPGNGDGTFQTRPADAVGSRPDGIAVADINGDGKPDAVVANYGGSTVSVLVGNGDGTFQSQQTVAVGTHPAAVALADVNGDGKPDLIAANYKDNTVGVLLGDGDGTFQPQQTLAVGVGPTAVTAADINGDGKQDLVVANYGGASVSVLLGNGNGTFQRQTAVRVGTHPFALTVADLGNGHLDVVVANKGDNTVGVLLGTGGGTFTAAKTLVVGSEPVAVAVADVNGDGKPDLVAANYKDNTVSVLWGDGDGTFQPQRTIPVGNYPRSVAAVDLNGDRNADLVVTNNADNTVSVLLGKGDGSFQPQRACTVGPYPRVAAVTDLNGDGRPDVVVTSNGNDAVDVLLGNGDGTFSLTSPAADVGLHNTPYLADLTGDGIPDSVILDRAGNIVFRQGVANGQFAPPAAQPLNPTRPARDLAVLRLGTGWAIAAAEASYDDSRSSANHFVYIVSLYTYGSDGQFHRTIAFTTTRLPTHIAAADLTGESRADLVVANALDHSIQVAFQNSDGTFTAPLTLATGDAPSDIAIADLNHDGLPDIAVTDQAGGTVSVFLNTGNGTFLAAHPFRSSAGLYAVGDTGTATVTQSLAQSVSLGAGDFTGQGRNDLVVLNPATGRFTVLANNGSGDFADPTGLLSASTSDGLSLNDQPDHVVAGYFRGPGQPLELAILMENRAEVWIYSNDGHGHFAHTFSVAVGSSPSGLSVIPNPQTGFLDLLVGNPFGDLLRLQGNGDGTFKPPPPLTGNRVPIVVRDLGNGQPSALVANQRSNQVEVQTPMPGSQRFVPVVTLANGSRATLAPGAVQWAKLDRDAQHFDAVVMGSGDNALLVYQATGFDVQGQPLFRAPVTYPVGTDPVSVLIQDVNGDGIADVLVADQGSNDVTELFGSFDAGGEWVGRAGPRLRAGGSGPVGLTLRDLTGDGIPDLVVTNGQSGTMAVLPGVGEGFFNDQNPQVLNLPGNPVLAQGPSSFGTSGAGVVLTAAGQLIGFNLVTSSFTAPAGAGVTAALALSDGDLVVAEQGGAVELMNASFDVLETLRPLTGIPSDPSALDVLESSSGSLVEALVTNVGQDTVFVFGVEAPTVLPPLEPGQAVAEPIVPSEAPLALVVTLSTGLLTTTPTMAAAPPPDEAGASEVASSEAQAGGGGDDDGSTTRVALRDGDTNSDLGPPLDELLRQIDLYEKPELRKDDPFSRREIPILPNGDAVVLAGFGSQEAVAPSQSVPRPERAPLAHVPLPAPHAQPGTDAAAAAPIALADAVWLNWPEHAPPLSGPERVERPALAQGPGEASIPGPEPAREIRRLGTWEQAALASVACGGLAIGLQGEVISPAAPRGDVSPRPRPSCPGRPGRGARSKVRR